MVNPRIKRFGYWCNGRKKKRSPLSVAAKKGTSLAVEREPGVGLRSGLRWAQKEGRS
jgi:hypothetical protein